MAAWRRRAIEAFPELNRELNDLDEVDSIYELWHYLLPMAQEAVDNADEDVLRRIFDYTTWCHRDRNHWNAVGVGFYEHLLDSERRRAAYLAWLPDDVIADVWGLWERRLGADGVKHIETTLRDSGRTPPPAHRRNGR